MQMKTWTSKPNFNFRMLVRAVVVTDQVDIEVFGNVGLDVTQQGEEFLMAMPRFSLIQHTAVGDVERCKTRWPCVISST